jgi:tripartite-type tricarboxylate transporter receptor subunit TctC
VADEGGIAHGLPDAMAVVVRRDGQFDPYPSATRLQRCAGMPGCARRRRAANKHGDTVMRSRTLFALLGAVGVLAGPAVAQSYPARPITLVVPFAPGGSASTAARSVADKMSETLGQQIIIDNRGGGGGTVATRSVAKAAPDGYTLLVVTSATVGTSPSLLQNLGYDARKDFDPIGRIAATPNLIAVHPSFPARSLAELIRIGKQTAAPIPYGSPGVGTLNHLTVELLAYRTGMKLAHVPYKGAGPALNDLLGGHIGVLISAVPNAHSHVVAGTIHGLAVTGAARAPLIPAVPTFAEAGLAGYEVPLRWGLAAPAGTPRPIIEKLNQALNAALASEEVRRRLAVEGAEAQPGTPEEYAAIIDREITMWSNLVKAVGIKPE